MDGAQFYVAGDIGDEASQATLNLGLIEEFDINSNFAVVNISTNRVVFAYDPKGAADTWKTGGTISLLGGSLFSYDGLTFDPNEEKGDYITTTADESEDIISDDDWVSIQRENMNRQSDNTSKEESYKFGDANILSAAKQTDKGITAINIGTGNNLSFIQQDTDPKERNVSRTGHIFRLDRKVNTFSGIKH